MTHRFGTLVTAVLLLLSAVRAHATTVEKRIESAVPEGMARTGSQGLAMAVIDRGKVTLVKTWGKRNAKGEPLNADTVMYGASLTKATFGYWVAQLADEGKIDLDFSIAASLPKPLPDYAEFEEDYSAWGHLAGDERWRKLTPRMLLNPSSGFANFYWLNADQRLQFHFEPGTRYAYSGDRIMLLQFVIEEGLFIQVEAEMQRHFLKSWACTIPV